MRFFITAAVILAILFAYDMANASIPPTKSHNWFCQFDPYNHPVLSFGEFDEYKKLKTKKSQRKFLTAHMVKQCGYVPKGSVK